MDKKTEKKTDQNKKIQVVNSKSDLKSKSDSKVEIKKESKPESKSNINQPEKEEKNNLFIIFLFGFLICLFISLLFYLFTKNILISGVVFIFSLIIVLSILYFIYLFFTNPKKIMKSEILDSKNLNKSPIQTKEDEDEINKKRLIRKNSIKFIVIGLIFGIIIGGGFIFFKKDWFLSAIFLIASPIVFFLFYFFKRKLEASARVKRIEAVFPDFLQMMSSNLRAGMTIDKAMFLSARDEFAPLDFEIQKAGKDITTGKTVEIALIDMSKRIGSDKINKVVLLILSGIRAGGNLATLLEETSVNIRERDFVEKRASSNVGMYVIFIFLTVALGAPILFSLSSVLVEILTGLLSSIPQVETNTALPFTMSSVNVSINFIIYFCIVFIITTDILASLTLGLVSKGEEKEGLKYLIPILVLSLSVFFIVRVILSSFMSSLFST